MLPCQQPRHVVFDIETAPLPDAAQWIEPAEAPANYKKPEAIAAYVAEKQAEAVAKAALDLDLCRIVAIGWTDSEYDQGVRVETESSMGEESMLGLFWAFLDNRNTIGYNSLGFDLPILLRRSLYLNVPAPRLNLNKYKSDQIDLMQVLSMSGTLRTRSLNFYCKRFGLDVPRDETTGADIYALVTVGDWGAVAKHCHTDVCKTVALARRLGYEL